MNKILHGVMAMAIAVGSASFIFLFSTVFSGSAFAALTEPNNSVRKDRLEQSQARTKKKKRSKKKAVDLSKLDEKGSSGSGKYGASRYLKDSGIGKRLKAYFDFAIFSQPGINGFSFANFHSYIFLEATPDGSFEFMTDVSSSRGSPSFYELDWHASDRLTIRAGKIWVPFDNFSPHNLFGGRTNVSIIQQDSQYRFLPNLWTELGAGAKYRLVDEDKMQLDMDAYVVNGFPGSGVDPLGRNSSYPSFADVGIATTDNNRAKSYGGRAHANLVRTFGVGVSYYRGRWNNQEESRGLMMDIFGADSQLYLGDFEVRAGVAQMVVQLETEKFRRGGMYGEAGLKLGKKRAWKILGRGGFLQTDDRIIDTNDQQNVGGTLLYRYKYMEYSLTYSRDLKKVAGKKNFSYTAFRMILQL